MKLQICLCFLLLTVANCENFVNVNDHEDSIGTLTTLQPNHNETDSGPNVVTEPSKNVTTTTPTTTTSITTTTTNISTPTTHPSTTVISTTVTEQIPSSSPITANPAPPAPTSNPHAKGRTFDGPSFIGGIILASGLTAIGFVAFKFYKARTERNYHTL
ncbi:PREDICTED: sialomucin core protein 24-like [Nicrophorus vespilloides]|uniref:Sialomucin core protein 24-like n=1 Tax=Nicrophorus vespilloides TaxID=110193 RepID=A0ABM1MND1_NICVS|nr:PREDICTED: sialomucin core protein 24-like [Nicrophorus vespilloides]